MKSVLKWTGARFSIVVLLALCAAANSRQRPPTNSIPDMSWGRMTRL